MKFRGLTVPRSGSKVDEKALYAAWFERDCETQDERWKSYKEDFDKMLAERGAVLDGLRVSGLQASLKLVQLVAQRGEQPVELLLILLGEGFAMTRHHVVRQHLEVFGHRLFGVGQELQFFGGSAPFLVQGLLELGELGSQEGTEVLSCVADRDETEVAEALAHVRTAENLHHLGVQPRHHVLDLLHLVLARHQMVDES